MVASLDESGRVWTSLVQSGRDLGILDEPRGLDSRRVWASLSGSGLFWASLDDLGRESMRVQSSLGGSEQVWMSLDDSGRASASLDDSWRVWLVLNAAAHIWPDGSES